MSQCVSLYQSDNVENVHTVDPLEWGSFALEFSLDIANMGRQKGVLGSMGWVRKARIS